MTEARLVWFKSSHSGGENNECVEVAFRSGSGGAHVRDSKDPDGGRITLPRAGWSGLLAAVDRQH
jgi:hypothetical protein